MRSGERGFSVLELAVALAVSAVALTLAASMLRNASGMIAVSGRALSDPPLPGLFAARLRADIEGATAITSLAGRSAIGLWSSAPLELATDHPPGLIRYQVVGGDLKRAYIDATGTVEAESTALRNIVWLRWRAINLRLLEVETLSRMEADPSAGTVSRPWLDAPALARDSLSVALRGGGMARGW